MIFQLILHLLNQYRMVDIVITPSADPIEMQAMYEEERAKLLQDIAQKNQLLNKTLEELKV